MNILDQDIYVSIELEELFKKVIRMVKVDPGLKNYLEFNEKYKENYKSLEDAAGNHAFDDYPEMFNITKQEGHEIRAFFQRYSPRKYPELRAYLQKLIETA